MLLRSNKILSGVVTKHSGQKTFKVKFIKHKLLKHKYNLRLKVFKSVLVHDESDLLQVGDRIQFAEIPGRKISKRKYHIFVKKC